MQEKEPTYCTRCNTVFQCREFDIANCQCSTIPISEKTKTFLASTNHQCLCKSCLAALNSMVSNFPVQECPAPQHLVENKHFYKENGYFVFTELYHYLKGSCCKNNCRHCAYGFKHKKQNN